MELEQVLATYPDEVPPLRMVKYSSFGQLDQGRMEKLINSSFNRTNNPDEFQKTIDSAYFENTVPTAIYMLESDKGDYAGIIIASTIQETKNSKAITYIDKLAVAPDHFGNGYMWKLLEALKENVQEDDGTAKMALRCNPTNNDAIKQYNKWKGHEKDIAYNSTPEWIVYTNGLTIDERKLVVDFAKDQKVYWQYKNADTATSQPVTQQPAT